MFLNFLVELLLPFTRAASFLADGLLCNAIIVIYNFMIYAARCKFFDVDTIRQITTNLYSLIAIFMLFIITIQLIKSIVDPEQLTTKEKGLGGIAGRIFVTLALIVIVPWMFNTGIPQIQKVLVGDYTYGEEASQQGIIQEVLNNGEDLSYSNPGVSLASKIMASFLEPGGGISKSVAENRINKLKNSKSILEFDLNMGLIEASLSTGILGTLGIGGASYNYTFIFSTIALLITLILVISFLLDVIKYVCQIWFLEIMSPIAIMSYVMPEHPVFDKWVKTTVKAYAMLMLRIVSISIIPIGINALEDVGELFVSGIGNVNWALNFTLMIGMLFFAKEFPEMLCNILGIDKGAGINAFGKMAFNKIGGVIAGAGKGMLSGAGAAFAESKGQKNRLGSLFKGAFSGIGTGARSGFSESNAKGINSSNAGKNASARYGGSWGEQREARRLADVQSKRNKREMDLYNQNKGFFNPGVTTTESYGENGTEGSATVKNLLNVSQLPRGIDKGLAMAYNDVVKKGSIYKNISSRLNAANNDLEVAIASGDAERIKKAKEMQEGLNDLYIAVGKQKGRAEKILEDAKKANKDGAEIIDIYSKYKDIK